MAEENYNWNDLFDSQIPPLVTQREQRKRLLLKFIWKWLFKWWMLPLLAAMASAFLSRAGHAARRRKKYRKVIKKGVFWDTTYYIERDHND